MAKKQLVSDPEAFQDVPVVKVLEMDPSKPYLIMFPKDAMTHEVEKFSEALSARGIFSVIICADPKDCQIFGSVPVYVEPRMDMIRIPMTGDLRLSIMQQLDKLGVFKAPKTTLLPLPGMKMKTAAGVAHKLHTRKPRKKVVK